MKKLAPVLACAVGLVLLATAPFTVAAGRYATAVFAGGCFWSMQHDMEHLPGIVDTEVGYTGGHVPNPTYQEVSSETTGHYESIKVTYDTSKLTYPQLVAEYLRITDPTDPGGAFCDRGPSYRPAIFVANEQQRRDAEAAILAAQPHIAKKIVTKILPLGPFYPAEGYHQHYADKNPVQYGIYREGCGKDRIVKAVWTGR